MPGNHVNNRTLRWRALMMTAAVTLVLWGYARHFRSSPASLESSDNSASQHAPLAIPNAEGRDPLDWLREESGRYDVPATE